MIPKLSWGFFWHWQRVRLEFRVQLLVRALIAATFWTVVLGLFARYTGQDYLALMLFLGVWVFFAWPTLGFHFVVFADLVNYLVTGKAYLMRVFGEMRAERTQTHEEWLRHLKQEHPFLYLYTRLAMLASYTSPLGPVAIWCALVLKRLPEDAYRTRENPSDILRIPQRAADIEGLIVEGFVHNGGRRAAAM